MEGKKNIFCLSCRPETTQPLEVGCKNRTKNTFNLHISFLSKGIFFQVLHGAKVFPWLSGFLKYNGFDVDIGKICSKSAKM